jgi:glycine betaine/choline ABC-type transport system substrate-binding protein
MSMIGGRKAIVFSIVVVFFFAIALAGNAQACVGRKLVLGSVEGARSSLVSRMLSILINERTGTTVEIEFFSSSDELFEKVKKGKVDLYVGYVERSLDYLGGS